MNFEHALEAMRQGKKVQMKSCPITLYFIDDGFIKIFDRLNGKSITVPFLSYAAILADDWEIHGEPLKEPEMTAEHAIENLESDTEPEHKCNACHCNCSHTGADSDLQEKMKRTLKSKFFELAESTTESSAVNIMLDIYRLFYGE